MTVRTPFFLLLLLSYCPSRLSIIIPTYHSYHLMVRNVSDTIPRTCYNYSPVSYLLFLPNIVGNSPQSLLLLPTEGMLSVYHSLLVYSQTLVVHLTIG